MALRIAIAGIAGRMGREVAAAAAADPAVTVVGGTVRPGAFRPRPDPAAVYGGRIVEQPGEILGDVDVMIDFTTPEGMQAHAQACASAGRPFVTGATGLDPAHEAALDACAEVIPVFAARSMSLGINVLLQILPSLVRALDSYDVEIVETHHHHKRDAPSGTALMLAEAIAAAQGEPLAEHAVYGRRGIAPRAGGDLGIHAVRAGGNPGEHTILLADEGEQIQLIHRAYSRRTYALGALRAAKFVVGKPPGRYTMAELLGAQASGVG